jgi:hypothetical protein
VAAVRSELEDRLKGVHLEGEVVHPQFVGHGMGILVGGLGGYGR